MVKDLNRVYRETPALWARDLTPEGFRWIDANDAAGNTFTFIRQGPGGPRDVLVAGINFAGDPAP